MPLPGRQLTPGSYRYGFQNQETDPEMLGGGVSFKYRVHDPRIGRFLSVDPLAPEYPWNSPYAFSENRVIDGVELEGRELLDADESRIEITGGIAVLKLENFSSVFNFNFKYLSYPNNWGLIESQLGKHADGTYYIQYSGPMVVAQHGFATANVNAPTGLELTDVSEDHAKFLRNRPNNSQRRAEERMIKKGKVVTPVNVPKYGKGMGGAVGIVNLMNFALNTYGSFTISDDMSSLRSDFEAYRKAYKIMGWARKNWCDDYAVDVNDLSAMNRIMNYVLQGETKGASKEEIVVAQDILARIGELKTKQEDKTN